MAQYFIDLTKSIASFEEAVRASHSDIGKKEIAAPVLSAVVDHWMQLNQDRHHPWAKGEGYYAGAAKNTHVDLTPEGFEVVTDKVGLNLRIFGGVVHKGANPSCITGQPTKYLTIPAIAEAYGRGACDVGDLAFVKFGNTGKAALMERGEKSAFDMATGKRIKNVMKQAGTQGAFGRRVWFWLVESTTHRPDPSVAPDIEQIEKVAGDAAEAYLEKFFPQ